MNRFGYVALQRSGERVVGNLQSASRREAVGKLLELGYHPITVEQEDRQRAEAREALRRVFGRVRTTDLAVFTRQFAALLKAGLPMIAALETLQQQCGNRQLARVIQDVRASLSQDATGLADAMAAHPKVFSPVYRGLVRSGEEGGRLVEVLDDLAMHLTRAAKLRGQVVGAFIYPLFLLLMGSIAVFVLMAFVIPKFQRLFESLKQELPWPTRVLIAVSGFLSHWWWAVLLVIAVAALFGLFALRRAAVRERIDTALLRLPLLGSVILKLEAARVARTLGALLRGGVRIVEALDITARTVRNGAVRATFGPIGKAVATGEELGASMEKTKLYPPLMINLIRTGEETGELPEMLEELASIYDDEAERAVNGAVKLLEPILIVVMGLIIAGIVAAVMLPIFHSSTVVS